MSLNSESIEDDESVLVEELGNLIELYRPRLRRLVDGRLDRRVRRRVDPSDVLQETFLEATIRLPRFEENPEVSVYTWLRFLTAQKVAEFHRRHLGRQNRDARREVQLSAGSAGSEQRLLDNGPSPSAIAMTGEKRERLLHALRALRAADREVLMLRHFEGLSNLKVAELLGLSPPAASLRFVRALRRLGQSVRDRSDPESVTREG